jgi:hypothetical protein
MQEKENKTRQPSWVLSVFLALAIVVPSRRIVAAVDVTEWKDPALLSSALSKALLSFQNIQISGSAARLQYDPNTQKFDIDSGGCNFTECLKISGGAESRIDFNPTYMPWTNGAGPFFAQEKSVAYNGKYALDVVYKEGALGHLSNYNRATIFGTLDKDNSFHVSSSLLPDQFISTLLNVDDYKSLSEMLVAPTVQVSKGPGSIDFHPTCEVIKNGGRDMIHVVFVDSATAPCNKEEIWIDPDRGFLLTKRVRSFDLCVPGKTDRPRWEYVVDEAKQFAPGVWLPVTAHVSRYWGDVPREIVSVYVSKVAFNIPDNGDLFNPKLKIGTRVTDNRFGITFQVGADPEGVVDGIESMPNLKR